MATSVMQDNDPVFLEMSAAHDRYHAAMMRSAWLGRPPAIAIEMEKVCQEALQASSTPFVRALPAKRRTWPARR